MECIYCQSKPCKCAEGEIARANGRHCGHLISKVPNQYPIGSHEAMCWEIGFKEGRQDLRDEFNAWLKSKLKERGVT